MSSKESKKKVKFREHTTNEIHVSNDYDRFGLDFLVKNENGRIMNGEFDVTDTSPKLYGCPTGAEDIVLRDYMVYRPVPKELIKWRVIPSVDGDSMDMENWYKELIDYCVDGVWVDGEFWNPFMVYWLNVFVFPVYKLDEEGDFIEDFDPGHPFYSNIDRYILDVAWKAEITRQDVSLMGGRGVGKALSLDTKILTKELGYINNGDLEVGQHVYNRAGKPTRILAVHDHKNKEMYRVTLSDGRSLEVCDEHLWGVYDHKKKVTTNKRGAPTKRYPKGRLKKTRGEYKVLSTQELLNNGLTYSNRQDNRYFIPMQEAVDYPSVSHHIMPYTLGALIGDGCMTGSTITFTNHPDDIHIVLRMNKDLKGIGCRLNTRPSNKYSYGVISDTNYHNQVSLSIETLGLKGHKSYNKFIPKEYLVGSIKQRTDLLHGLMDTDGYCTKTGTPQFCTVSDQLKDDFLQLCSSLGIRAEAVRKRTSSPHGYAWTVTLKTNTVVFSLPRKVKRQKTIPGNRWASNTHSRVPIVSIEYIGTADARCISIDDEEFLYQAGTGHIVTHNSYLWGCIMDREWRLFPGSWTVVSSTNDETTSEAWNKIEECITAVEKKHKALKHKRIADSASMKWSGEIIELPDGTTEKRGYLAKFEKITYGKNAGKTRGKRPTKQLIEEFAAFPPSSQKGNLRSCMRESKGSWVVGGAIKKCTVLYSGTGGTVENDEAEDIFCKPSAHNIIPTYDWEEAGDDGCGIFIPTHIKRSGTWEKTGCSDIKLATELVQEERDAAFHDPQSYIGLLQEFPMTIKEVFMRSGVNIFNADKISQQRVTISKNEKGMPKPERGFLNWTRNPAGKITGVTWDPTPYGDIEILEHPHWLSDRARDDEKEPMPGLYVMGVDSIDQGNRDSSFATDNKKGSELAALVKKRIVDKGYMRATSNIYVAKYNKRSDNVKDDHDNALKLSYYYNAKVNIEYTKVGIVSHFRNEGFYNMLSKRPTINLGTADPRKTSHLIGTTTGSAIINHQDELIADYINESYQEIWFPDVLEQLQDYDRDNRTKFDMVIAMGLCELADEDLMGKAAKPAPNITAGLKKIGFYTEVMPDGRRIKRRGVIPDQKNRKEMEGILNAQKEREMRKFQESGGVRWINADDPDNPSYEY